MANRDLNRAVGLLTAIYDTLPAGNGESVSAEELAETLNARGREVSEEAVEAACWFLYWRSCLIKVEAPVPRWKRLGVG